MNQAASPQHTRRVRRATPADLETLVHGNLSLAHETEGLTLDAATVRAGVLAVIEERTPGCYYVLEEDARVVAQLLVTYEWSDWRNRPVWWIASVFVPPHHRRHGAFAALYRDVVERAQRAGAGGLRLYVDRTNHRAMRAYEALGMNGQHYALYEHMFEDEVTGRS